MKTITITRKERVGCLGNGFKRVGPCQDGLFYKVKCVCDECVKLKPQQKEKEE